MKAITALVLVMVLGAAACDRPDPEVHSGITQPYEVLLVAADGSTTTFSIHP